MFKKKKESVWSASAEHEDYNFESGRRKCESRQDMSSTDLYILISAAVALLEQWKMHGYVYVCGHAALNGMF